jgi:hypothetical protein
MWRRSSVISLRRPPRLFPGKVRRLRWDCNPTAGPHREQDFQAEGAWTAEGLADNFGPFYDTRKPMAGYVMPYQ